MRLPPTPARGVGTPAPHLARLGAQLADTALLLALQTPLLWALLATGLPGGPLNIALFVGGIALYVEIWRRTGTSPGKRLFGQRFAARRRRLKISQALLASAIGAERRVVIDIEQGRETVAIGRIARLAREIGLPMSTLDDCLKEHGHRE